MKIKKYTFTETGEIRPPKKGEYYWANEILQASRVITNNVYSILTLEVTEEECSWKPIEGQLYWYVGTSFEPRNSNFANGWYVDVQRFKNGNCFPTKELCEQFIKEKGLR